jgi:hypothetical protein
VAAAKAAAIPRSTPLTMVSRALAGDDPDSVAASASEALGLPVAIALPALGRPVVSPAQAASGSILEALSGKPAQGAAAGSLVRPTAARSPFRSVSVRTWWGP